MGIQSGENVSPAAAGLRRRRRRRQLPLPLPAPLHRRFQRPRVLTRRQAQGRRWTGHLDYALTNSDLHTLFSRFGRVAVHKYRGSRRRRGVAFVLFVRREHAAAEMHGKVLNGRTLSSSIAEDNGRAAEFIRCRVYRDRSRCYECGKEGHLSYECPRNQLGPRERPPPSKKSRRGGGGDGSRGGGASWQSDDEDGATAFEDDRWASVVDTRGDEEKAAGKEEGKAKAVKEKRRSYFSDASDEDEDED